MAMSYTRLYKEVKRRMKRKTGLAVSMLRRRRREIMRSNISDGLGQGSRG